MRLGLDLQGFDLDRATEADRFGLWAVLVSGPPGTEAVRAAAVAARTRHTRIAVRLDVSCEHPFTLAEEMAVVDNIAAGRLLVVVDPPVEPEAWRDLERALSGGVVGGALVAPPPHQLSVPVLTAPVEIALTGDLDADRSTIDRCVADGSTHVFAAWPGPVAVLARHLATRAAMIGFPTIVAELADRIAPLDET